MTESSATHSKRLLDLLSHAGQIVSSSKSPGAMLEATIGLIRTVFEVERCSILIYDPVAQVLRMKAAAGIPAEEWEHVRVRIGHGISGQVAQSGRPLLVEDIRNSDFAELEQRARYQTSAFICVPLLVKGHSIGVVNINNRSDERRFGQEDLDLMVALSGFVALAIDNSRLLTASNSARNQLEMIVEGLPHAVFTMNTSRIITLCNLRLLRLLGLNGDTPAEGRCIEEMFPTELLQPIIAMQRETLDYGLEVRREIEAPMTGSVPAPFEITMAPLPGSSGAVSEVPVTLQDTIIRHEVSELRRLDELKTRFLSVVSHELRTPLTSIKGAVHLLLNPAGAEATNPTKGLAVIISKNTERLIRLVNDLLEMANIENHALSLVRKPEDLKVLLNTCVEQESPAAEAKGVYVHSSLEEVTASVDRARLTQAVRYLLDNAIKFTPRGGHVRVLLEADDNRALISVEDTGCGVSPEAQEKIFGKFYQVQDPLTRSCGGTGIGLFLARAIIEKHGGRIALTSEPNSEGARFTIELPVNDAALISRAETPAGRI